jgi:cold shock CspA family protein
MASGSMLWFNEEKRHGLILTEDGERLKVHVDGFRHGAPIGRCAQRPVEFRVSELEGERVAVDVLLLVDEEQGRARRRRSTNRVAP